MFVNTISDGDNCSRRIELNRSRRWTNFKVEFFENWAPDKKMYQFFFLFFDVESLSTRLYYEFRPPPCIYIIVVRNAPLQVSLLWGGNATCYGQSRLASIMHLRSSYALIWKWRKFIDELNFALIAMRFLLVSCKNVKQQLNRTGLFIFWKRLGRTFISRHTGSCKMDANSWRLKRWRDNFMTCT